MEVHKHPHHVMHKKKWTEYLLEFFMLFLAVFLGFIAENLREHLVDKERAEQYMHTMVGNLKYDTTRCGGITRVNMRIANGLDSLRYEIGKAISGKADANRLYYFYLKYGLSGGHAAFNRAAFEQMQNSGSLRLIKNNKLVNDVLDYYNRYTLAPEQAFNLLAASRENNFLQTCKQVFDWQYFDELYTNERTYLGPTDTAREHFYASVLIKQPQLQLLTSNPKDLQKLYNDAAETESRFRNYNSFLRWTEAAADTLMLHINQTYNFSESD